MFLCHRFSSSPSNACGEQLPALQCALLLLGLAACAMYLALASRKADSATLYYRRVLGYDAVVDGIVDVFGVASPDSQLPVPCAEYVHSHSEYLDGTPPPRLGPNHADHADHADGDENPCESDDVLLNDSVWLALDDLSIETRGKQALSPLLAACSSSGSSGSSKPMLHSIAGSGECESPRQSISQHWIASSRASCSTPFELMLDTCAQPCCTQSV